MRSDLIKDLSPKSKTLEKLCTAFVDRDDAVRCIISFFEQNKLRGKVVSAHYRCMFTTVCDF